MKREVAEHLGIFIYIITMDDFMEDDPPCKKCLVKAMCVTNTSSHKYSSIRINMCEEFKEYIQRKFKDANS